MGRQIEKSYYFGFLKEVEIRVSSRSRTKVLKFGFLIGGR